MPLPDQDAPYSGGFLPGGRIFAVDGDWTIDSPDGPPEISYPFNGDSTLSLNDVVLKQVNDNALLGFEYKTFPMGYRQNYQPWSPNQKAFIIDQRFTVAFEHYKPLPLNTPYNPDWALPWAGELANGFSLLGLAAAILVEEGTTSDRGGGLIEIHRKFATIPSTRNDTETFCLKRVSFGIGGFEYTRAPQVVMSRLQHDFFVYDNENILDFPLFTDLTTAGIRLNADTGFRPKGLIIEAQKFYGVFTDVEIDLVFDADKPYGETSDIIPSTPSLSQYRGWMDGSGQENGLPAEIVIEGSTISRYLGNILQRTTRFAEAV